MTESFSKICGGIVAVVFCGGLTACNGKPSADLHACLIDRQVLAQVDALPADGAYAQSAATVFDTNADDLKPVVPKIQSVPIRNLSQKAVDQANTPSTSDRKGDDHRLAVWQEIDKACTLRKE